jgi:hypothetical protein
MSVIHVFVRFTSGDGQHTESESNDRRKQRYILLTLLAKGFWRTVKSKALPVHYTMKTYGGVDVYIHILLT